MKRITWLILLTVVSSMLLALNGTIAVSSEQTRIQLYSNSQTGMTVQYTIGNVEYKETATSQGNFTDISIDGYTTTNRTGLPKLPLQRKIIRVPLNAEVTPVIFNKVTTTVSLSESGIYNKILPRQESISKSEDVASAPFVLNNKFYNGENWTDDAIVKIEEIGMMRGARLVALDFTPIRYNPKTSELEIITSATVDITYPGADWALTEDTYNRFYSPVFETTLAQSVFNYESSRVSLDRFPLGMIIVSPTNYVTTLQPFINWKKMQGYNVTLATTDVTGTSTSSIKNYIQNIWNSATTQNPAPSYLLIVGDTPQIPAFNSTTLSGHVSDLSYVRLQGSDYVPEMYFGRFSATSTAQLQAIIDKTLQYEKYTMPDPSYLSHTVLIAGVDASNAATYGNGQIRYGKNNYFGESASPAWTPFGQYQIRNHMYLYPGSGSSDAQIIQDINGGLGYINYTAHGSETSWSDPTLTISNINGLTNTNKYFVAVGNCCLTNAFDTSECFGEAFTRAANKGAVAYIGGTNSTYWDEDYYWAVGHKPPVVSTGSPYVANKIGVYDAIFHNNSEAYADWASTLGAMNFMGNMAVTAYNGTKTNYYWEIYSIMGDPSLIPYMGIPLNNDAEYSQTVPIGQNSMQITAEPYTYVAVSQNDVLHGTGLTGADGQLALSFTPFTSPGSAKIVMTRSLRKPVIADLQITTTAGPYLLLSNMVVNDSNNSTPEAGETLYLNMTLNNVGTAAAQSITATLTSNSNYVTILHGTASIGNIQINTPVYVNNTFQVQISSAIPDQQNLTFTLQLSDNLGNTWNGSKNLVVNAPNMSIGAPSYIDTNSDGVFMPGEAVTISLGLTNNGHMNANSSTLVVVINSDDASIGQNTFTIPNVNIGGSYSVSFPVTIASTASVNSFVPIGIALSVGTQLVNDMISLPIGAISEGFESGTFNIFPWINTSSFPWTTVSGTSNAHSGNYCARSGAINHASNTVLSVTKDIIVAGNITFWRKISSEPNYDKLEFYIDNTLKGTWSGAYPEWTQESFGVTTGTHTFKWLYKKDYSGSTDSDCVWIDDIVFPIVSTPDVPIFYNSDTVLNFADIPVNTTATRDIKIRNLGAATLTGTIAVPQFVTLLEDYVVVNNTHNYSIPGGLSKIYSVRIAVTSILVLDDTITITSNDGYVPTQIVPLHLNSVTSVDPIITPVITKLDGNYPNPFNPETSIRFSTKEQGNVIISVYNSKGQLIKTLVNENKKSGNHAVIWNGTDKNGKPVSSGLYLYKMQTKDYSLTKKMMLMK